MITKQEFEQLKPYTRGFVVALADQLDTRELEPNVPSESNPYQFASEDYLAWERGKRAADYEAQLVDDENYENESTIR